MKKSARKSLFDESYKDHINLNLNLLQVVVWIIILRVYSTILSMAFISRPVHILYFMYLTNFLLYVLFHVFMIPWFPLKFEDSRFPFHFILNSILINFMIFPT